MQATRLVAEGTLSPAGPVARALHRIADEARLTRALRARLLDVAAGRSYEEIARLHGISVNTVKTQISHLFQHLGVYCRHEIEHAVEAAGLRSRAGAGEQQIYQFLRLRWE